MSKVTPEYYLELFNKKITLTKKNAKQAREKVDSFLEAINVIYDSDDRYESFIESFNNDPYLHNYTADYINLNLLSVDIDSLNNESIENIKNKFKLFKESFKNFDFLGISSSLQQFIWSFTCIMTHTDPRTGTHFQYNFGDVHCDLVLGSNNAFSIKVHPLCNSKNPNTFAKTNSAVFHPHISKNKVACIGSYVSDINADISNFRYLDIMFNITSVLQEYNPRSLQDGCDISEWIGEKCGFCHTFIGDKVEKVKCNKSFNYLHKSCGVEYKSNYYNPIHIKECSVCSKSSPLWAPINGKIVCEDCINGNNS